MTAKIRQIPRQFSQTHSLNFDNVLVSGCSFTYNNHETVSVTWPYYLRDFAGINEVYDCSQISAGSNHIFNSVVNEIESNQNINPDNTLVLIMWSGLTRTDCIATQDITAPWHNVSNYCFDSKFATLGLLPNTKSNSVVATLSNNYRLVVDPDAQIYESMLKILALEQYLKSKKFQFVFMSWMDPVPELNRLQNPLTKKISDLLATVPYLWEYAVDNKLVGYSHPSPDGHLMWTRHCLLPWLHNQKILNLISDC